MDGPGSKAESARSLWRRDHERLDRTFVRLLDAFRLGDPEALREEWNRFEADLRGHISAEEHGMIALFAQVDPAEAAALRDEHAAILRLLDEIGLGVDLQTVNLGIAQELVDRLRRHAQREDQLLYRWAERQLESLREESEE